MKPSLFDRKRVVELFAIFLVTASLIGISRLESRLYKLSEDLARDHNLLASIFYYGLINLNVFIAVLLIFLVIRNVAKLVVERRRGVFGSRLRTKLVAVLLVFALVPTVIVFYVSTRFITKSFDEWFGWRVKATTQTTRDAGAQIYLQDQRRLEITARSVATKIQKSNQSIERLSESKLSELRGGDYEYGSQIIAAYDVSGKLIFRDSAGHAPDEPKNLGYSRDAALEFISRFIVEPYLVNVSAVTIENGRDVIRAAVSLRGQQNRLVGVVLVEERFDTPVLANIQTILTGLSTLKPGSQLVRVSYLILVTVLTLLIVFGVLWFGFYVARAISGPLQLLADATKEVSLGNYAVTLQPGGEDETGQLTRSFNIMTGVLADQQRKVEVASFNLETTNQELDRRRRYMEAVFRNISSGIIALDGSGRVTAFNDAAVEMLSITHGDFLGVPAKKALGDVLYRLLPLDEARDNFSREISLSDAGLDTTIFVKVSKVESEQGEFQGIVCVLDDATDRIRMQRASAWREVAKRIAHEIKNPITPIRLSAERILRKFAHRFEGDDRNVFESCIESILVHVDSLKSLVNEFGKFSKMPTIMPKRTNLNGVIETVLDIFRHGYPGITIETSLDELPDLLLDIDQFNRVLTNIFSNAVDAIQGTGREGFIKVMTKFDPNLQAVVILISDNGIGISPSVRDRIFEPYFSTKSGGTGLGLAMVNQIVSDHGGYIRVMPTDDVGSVFRIELPVNQVKVGS